MKSNAIKMMILLLATALLCFGTTMTVSASVDGGDESAAIEATDGATTDDGATVETEDDGATTDDEGTAESGDEGGAEGEAAPAGE